MPLFVNKRHYKPGDVVLYYEGNFHPSEKISHDFFEGIDHHLYVGKIRLFIGKICMYGPSDWDSIMQLSTQMYGFALFSAKSYSVGKVTHTPEGSKHTTYFEEGKGTANGGMLGAVCGRLALQDRYEVRNYLGHASRFVRQKHGRILNKTTK